MSRHDAGAFAMLDSARLFLRVHSLCINLNIAVVRPSIALS